jgi:integrase
VARKYAAKSGPRYYAVIELGRDPQTGKRRQEVITEDPATGLPMNKARAKQVEREALTKLHRGNAIDPVVTPFGVFLDRWLTETAGTRAESTHVMWSSVVRSRLVPGLGAIPLAHLSTLHIEAYYRTQIQAGYATGTITIDRGIINGALVAAKRWKLLESNPATGAAFPKAEPKEEREVWTAEQSRLFLTSCAGSPWSALWRLLLDSAMRIGEALALTWADLDIESRTVMVRKTVAVNRDRVNVVRQGTKSESGRRSIVLAPATIDALKRQRAKQNERRLELGPFWQATDLIFDRHDGGLLNPNMARHYLARDIAATELPALTPHELRHTSLTLAVAAGEPLHAVMRRAGHKNISITANLYSHYSRDADENAVVWTQNAQESHVVMWK